MWWLDMFERRPDKLNRQGEIYYYDSITDKIQIGKITTVCSTTGIYHMKPLYLKDGERCGYHAAWVEMEPKNKEGYARLEKLLPDIRRGRRRNELKNKKNRILSDDDIVFEIEQLKNMLDDIKKKMSDAGFCKYCIMMIEEHCECGKYDEIKMFSALHSYVTFELWGLERCQRSRKIAEDHKDFFSGHAEI